MDGARGAIVVEVPTRGFARADVIDAMLQSGVDIFLETAAPGPFGRTALATAVLEALVDAADVGILAHERLHGQIMADLGGGVSFSLPTLAPEHRQVLATFQIVATVDVFLRRLEELCGAPVVDGELELDGLLEILESDVAPVDALARLMMLGRAYAELNLQRAGGDEGPKDRRVIHALAAFLALLRRTVIRLANETSARPLAIALSRRQITVAGYPYRGLEVQDQPTARAGLLPMRPESIVGNDDYLAAGMRLARDVAGFDLDAQKNPKRINPVLFGLGKPGCGKTVTAHAVGNYFLDYCRERDVPARFIVVRRTDWASSYQNASANNLVRLFREEVYGFEGVCGVYWPDIDTAFASRDSSQLRSEEKNNLAAVFGIFDGTLLPRDGKWFLICDANTLHMDEATISRIAQNPYTVEGPTEPDDFVTLMRDIQLDDLEAFLAIEEAGWSRIGAHAANAGLSGRNVDSICGNIRAEVQDFEFPEAYFSASAERRVEIVASLGNVVDEARVIQLIDDFVAFRRSAEARSEDERFEREVDAIVMRLNASMQAAQRAAHQTDEDQG